MRRDQGGMNWDGRRRKPPRSVVFIAFENRAIWLDDNFPIWQMVMRRRRVWARELKAWHGVHYLLCGDIEPGSAIPSQAVMGGVELGEDLGYGPARYFETGKVNQIAQALSAANLEAEMIARFDPVKMTSLGI